MVERSYTRFDFDEIFTTNLLIKFPPLLCQIRIVFDEIFTTNLLIKLKDKEPPLILPLWRNIYNKLINKDTVKTYQYSKLFFDEIFTTNLLIKKVWIYNGAVFLWRNIYNKLINKVVYTISFVARQLWRNIYNKLINKVILIKICF